MDVNVTDTVSDQLIIASHLKQSNADAGTTTHAAGTYIAVHGPTFEVICPTIIWQLYKVIQHKCSRNGGFTAKVVLFNHGILLLMKSLKFSLGRFRVLEVTMSHADSPPLSKVMDCIALIFRASTTKFSAKTTFYHFRITTNEKVSYSKIFR